MYSELETFEAINQFGESIVVRSAFAEESGKYCVLLRKAATYLVTNKGNIQAT